MTEYNNKQKNEIAERIVKQFMRILKNNLQIRNMVRVAIRSFDEQDFDVYDKGPGKAKKTIKQGRREHDNS